MWQCDKLGSPAASGFGVNHSRAGPHLTSDVQRGWFAFTGQRLDPKTYLLGPKGITCQEQRVELKDPFCNVRATATGKSSLPSESGSTGDIRPVYLPVYTRPPLQKPFPETPLQAGLGAGARFPVVNSKRWS